MQLLPSPILCSRISERHCQRLLDDRQLLLRLPQQVRPIANGFLCDHRGGRYGTVATTTSSLPDRWVYSEGVRDRFSIKRRGTVSRNAIRPISASNCRGCASADEAMLWWCGAGGAKQEAGFQFGQFRKIGRDLSCCWQSCCHSLKLVIRHWLPAARSTACSRPSPLKGGA